MNLFDMINCTKNNMGGHKFNFTPTPSLLPLFFLFFLRVTVRAIDVCANVDCGKGTCVPSDSSILGFDCVCYSGWNKIQIGPLTFPSCVVPNCTLNFHCGNPAPPPPPPPPVAPPPFNLFDSCSLVWCGDGTCVANVTSHYCKCFEGSANLLNLTALACFKQCSFGADCKGLGLGPPVPPPPPLPNGMLATPPPLPPRSPPNGSHKISKNSGSYDRFNIFLLSALIWALVM